jgi:nucleotide-binding universal stress UspA family protein
VTRIHRILVPVVETVASERAVELACRLGEDQKAEIILAFIMVVPMSLPLETPLPSLEAAGRQALDTARFIVHQHNLLAKPRIMPQRAAADGILRIAREEQVDAIIMGVEEHRHALPGPLGRTVLDVIRKAECEVILDKVQKA